MKKRSLFIILSLFVAILAVVLLTKQDGTSGVLAKDLIVLDTSRVSKVEIISPGEEIVLLKK